jgi:hypothetical protein
MVFQNDVCVESEIGIFLQPSEITRFPDEEKQVAIILPIRDYQM